MSNLVLAMPMRHDIPRTYTLKSVIEDLLGSRAWFDLKETVSLTSLTKWWKCVFKLFDAIELSVKITILIRDDDRMQEIPENIKCGEDTDDLTAALPATLLQRVFLQFVEYPPRKTVPSVSLKAECSDFSGFRSIQVVQTPKQRRKISVAR